MFTISDGTMIKVAVGLVTGSITLLCAIMMLLLSLSREVSAISTYIGTLPPKELVASNARQGKEIKELQVSYLVLNGIVSAVVDRANENASDMDAHRVGHIN